MQNQTIRDDFRTSEPTNTKTPDNRSPTEPKTQNTKKQTTDKRYPTETKNKNQNLKNRGFQKPGGKTHKNKTTTSDKRFWFRLETFCLKFV
jgi:hypothetical protein